MGYALSMVAGARDLLRPLVVVVLLASGCASAPSRRIAAGPAQSSWLEQTPIRTPEDIARDLEASAELPDSYGRHELFTCPPGSSQTEPTFECFAAKRTKHEGFHLHHSGHGHRVR